MADERARVERELRDLARDLDAQIGERDLSQAVVAELATSAPEPVSRTRRPARRVVVLAAAVAAVLVFAIPSARAAVADFLRFGAEHIHDEPPPAARRVPPTFPNGSLPDLGRKSSLAEARQRMPIVVPAAAGFTAPDEVWFDELPGGRASLVFHARDGLPSAGGTGIGLLIQEFGGDGTTAVNKYLSGGTRIEQVSIGGTRGVFLSGEQHVVWYEAPGGFQLTEVGRLAGNALIFQRGSLTIRLEGDLDREHMIAIAASLTG